MRTLAYVLIGVLGGMGVMSLSQKGGPSPTMLAPVSYAMTSSEQASDLADEKPWTGDDLLEMAQVYDHQADELQSEAVRLEQRAISLAKKPHMDPKGFTRSGWMLIASTRWKSAKELRELAAMHRSEGQRILALEKNGEVPTEDLDKEGNASQKHGT
ncbi:hypothetical protein [Candidatus Nitrospira neomarina]|uniref:Uncharacterized protein n=1 Tax=Candidatus Nitrospira neomarina TaxID=3020899 RepID=A0AA96GQD8_9BACT|nr:hypothetical protein [Candidatus Nitrospira neomarina]WNM62239.1 hypothetical protein PQG83_00405 [Candidatus Nitrospira neomarina]